MYFPKQLSSSDNRQSYWCFVVLPSGSSKCNCRCLALSASEKDFWGFAFPNLVFTFRASFSLFRALLSRFRASFSRFQALLSCFRASLSRFRASRFQALLSRIWAPPSELDSRSFEPCAFKASHLWASFSGFHHFEPHLVGSLHSFDLVLTASGLRFRNTCPISIMSMRHVSKRTSQRTYKDNVSDMKLSCKAIEIRTR